MYKHRVVMLMIGLTLGLVAGCNKETVNTSVSNNTILVEKPTTDSKEDTTTLETNDNVDTELPEGKIKFVYDDTEDTEDYLSSKISIQGTGSVVDLQGMKDNVTSSETYDQTKATQQFWIEQAENKEEYYYAVDGYEWGRGFGPVMSVKYDIKVKGANEYLSILTAPNDTEITVIEKDPRVGDAKYWHDDILGTRGFSYFNLVTDIDDLEYNTPFILGTGLKDWSKFQYVAGEEDITVSGVTQLLCNISVDNMLGEGYYIEFADIETGLFESYMIIQRGDRVFCINAKSDYRESMKDICTATADRCIIVY